MERKNITKTLNDDEKSYSLSTQKQIALALNAAIKK
tara:strand:+ start:412 stop:519 length:108 start_codon:yes stop_codon:yes gene_type:complete